MRSSDFFEVIDAAIADVGKAGVLEKLSTRIPPCEMLFWLTFEYRPPSPLSDADLASMAEILRDGQLEHAIDPDWLHYCLTVADLGASGPESAEPIMVGLYDVLREFRAVELKPRTTDHGARVKFVRRCLLYFYSDGQVRSEEALRKSLTRGPSSPSGVDRFSWVRSLLVQRRLRSLLS